MTMFEVPGGLLNTWDLGAPTTNKITFLPSFGAFIYW